MGVVNLELAKNVTLNGRMPAGKDDQGNPVTKVVQVKLVPGLNNVTAEQMAMLEENSSFEYHCSVKEMSIVDHSESPSDKPPKEIKDIDITSMNVGEAGLVINSTATAELLDRFEKQERSLKNPRKGVLAAISKQRKVVGEVIAKHEAG